MNQTKKRRCLLCGPCLIFLSVSGCEPKVDLGVANKPEVAAPLDAKSPVETVNAPAVEKPASPEIKISDEAFRFAAHEGRIDTVRSSIKSGKGVNAKDPTTSYTAMHMAAYNGHSDIVQLLLEHDAEVDPRDGEGKTPLIHACTGPFPKTVEILVAAGADINAAETTEGFTPLMMAAGLGQLEVVKVLLSHGADTTLMDEDKDTALSHAKNSGHAEIVALLEK